MTSIKLFCLPHAGGSSIAFQGWKSKVIPLIKVCPIELKGRGIRSEESYYKNFEEAIDDIYNVLVPTIDGPYAILGHSMGSWLALELYYKLLQEGASLPLHMIFSGNKAPHSRRKEIIYHKLPNEEFRKAIQKIGGASNEIFENREIFSIFEPILRADFKMIENYFYKEKSNKVHCNMTIMTGKNDPKINSSDLMGWKKFAGANCNIFKLDGGHFFIQENIPAVIRVINQIFSPYVEK
ncbi:thioesterase [Pseudomonas sp. ISL-88]|uniref:thioesterase II family protein n=1 Tax=Bacteria TaxID=2 RepID=UPI001BEB7C9E|nr:MULTISPECIES: thioesterase domain-containing protein [Bacteria]MBT2635226.1 thioesterase [Bacillus sp. ISL-26]MBT2711409.1 thioesterase [Pseudomonas sp. ISL-88]